MLNRRNLVLSAGAASTAFALDGQMALFPLRKTLLSPQCNASK